MSLTKESRSQCAAALVAAQNRVHSLSAFVGLDGFVDDIIHVVDVRTNAESYTRLTTIEKLAHRLAAAAGKSTNLEVVSQLTKLGGNGPIMANALASLGMKVAYLGNLGFPKRHRVFDEFAQRAEVHSIAEPGYTDALEFEDGKVMVGKHTALKEVNWPNITERFGRDQFQQKLATSDLVAFVNWTMLPYMSDVWSAVQQEICPALNGPRRKIFIDLADPEKRTREDLRRALELIASFERHFDVIFGMNEKEANEVAKALALDRSKAQTREGLVGLAQAIHAQVPVNTIVVHPVQYALAVSAGQTEVVDGPYTAKPKITTGAGDHFNAGFCLGKLLGFDNAAALLAGVSCSGFYVFNAKSPNLQDLANIITKGPQPL